MGGQVFALSLIAGLPAGHFWSYYEVLAALGEQY
jgi:hypothetical protein